MSAHNSGHNSSSATTRRPRKSPRLIKVAQDAPAQTESQFKHFGYAHDIIDAWGLQIWEHYSWYKLNTQDKAELHHLSLMARNWKFACFVLNEALAHRHPRHLERGNNNASYAVGDHPSGWHVADVQSPLLMDDIRAAIRSITRLRGSGHVFNGEVVDEIDGQPIEEFNLKHDHFGLIVPRMNDNATCNSGTSNPESDHDEEMSLLSSYDIEHSYQGDRSESVDEETPLATHSDSLAGQRRFGLDSGIDSMAVDPYHDLSSDIFHGRNHLVTDVAVVNDTDHAGRVKKRPRAASIELSIPPMTLQSETSAWLTEESAGQDELLPTCQEATEPILSVNSDISIQLDRGSDSSLSSPPASDSNDIATTDLATLQAGIVSSPTTSLSADDMESLPSATENRPIDAPPHPEQIRARISLVSRPSESIGLSGEPGTAPPVRDFYNDRVQKQYAKEIAKSLRSARQKPKGSSNRGLLKALLECASSSEYLAPIHIEEQLEETLGCGSAAKGKADVSRVSEQSLAALVRSGGELVIPIIIRQDLKNPTDKRYGKRPTVLKYIEDRGVHRRIKEEKKQDQGEEQDQEPDMIDVKTGEIIESITEEEYEERTTRERTCAFDANMTIGNVTNLSGFASTYYNLEPSPLSKFPRFAFYPALMTPLRTGGHVPTPRQGISSNPEYMRKDTDPPFEGIATAPNNDGVTYQGSIFPRILEQDDNGAWYRCVKGLVEFFIIPDTNDKDWEMLARKGEAWSPCGRFRRFFLEEGETVIFPTSRRLIYAYMTHMPTIMEGSPVWDVLKIPQALENTLSDLERRLCHQQQMFECIRQTIKSLQQCLDHGWEWLKREWLLPDQVPGYATIEHYHAECLAGIKRLEQLGCECEQECGQDCPCQKAKRSCNCWCKAHTDHHPDPPGTHSFPRVECIWSGRFPGTSEIDLLHRPKARSEEQERRPTRQRSYQLRGSVLVQEDVS